jgi:hypothetical protein
MKDQGPFDRMLESSASRDRQARMILIGMGVVGVILLILVLPPISLLSGGDSGVKSERGAVPRAPDGFEALSRVYSLERPRDGQGPYALTVNLAAPVTDGRNLALYTSRAGRWERLATATLVNNGAAVQAEVADFPANIVVFRVLGGSSLVSGSLPRNSQIDPEAVDLIGVLNPLDYAPAADGSVVGAPTPFQRSDRMTIVPTVRAATPVESEAVNAILASRELREAHIESLVNLATQQDYAGIDIDYRNVAPARKADFTAFVTSLGERLHQANRRLSLTLPAPVRTGVTWDSGPYDWEALGRVADTIKIVPDQDPSAYYGRLEEVMGYLRPKMDLKKLVLVIGRDSREKGSDGLRSLSLIEALTRASEVDVRTQNVQPNASVVIVGKNIFQDDGATGLRWDEAAFAVSFSYPGQGGQRTVWIENSLSIAFRIDFARRYGLGGVSLEDVSLNPNAPNVWGTVRTYAETGQVPLVAPNGALLRPTWQSGAGALEASQRGNVVWRAPAQPGSYEVFLIISDGVIRVSQKVVVEVRSATTTVALPTRTP